MNERHHKSRGYPVDFTDEAHGPATLAERIPADGVVQPPAFDPGKSHMQCALQVHHGCQLPTF
ncbi:MAG: hypothetical protein ABSH50_08995 [Bryobacteraceae bacterium]